MHVVLNPVNDAPTFGLVDPLVVRYDVPYVFDLTHYIHDSDNPYGELTLSVDSESVPYTRTDNGMLIIFIYPKSLEGATRSVVVTVTDLREPPRRWSYSSRCPRTSRRRRARCCPQSCSMRAARSRTWRRSRLLPRP